MAYYIYSKDRSGDGTAAWWRPKGQGYTVDLSKAGKFEEDEARRIVNGSDKSVAVSEEDAAKLATRTIVDLGDADNLALMDEIRQAGLNKARSRQAAE